MRCFSFLLVLVWVGFSQVSYAQSDDDGCPTGEAEAMLDVGNVRARIFNNGGLFWRGSPHVYEVPKDSGISSIFVTSLWVGGLVGGELRTAATRYGPYEFWPGPLGVQADPDANCGAAYDRLYSIRRDDIVGYERNGNLTDDLRDWPVHLGAPVLDGDGVPDNYNLAGGDRPELLGDQTEWWVMNDAGGVHEETDSPPIGLEACVTAFAFDVPGTVGTSTFYRYRFTYHGDASLDSIPFK